MDTNTSVDLRERPSFVRMLVAVVSIILVLLGLIAIVAIGVTFHLKYGGPPTVTLPGGVRMEFIGAEQGATQFSSDKPWMTRLRKILPVKLQGWLMPPPVSGTCSWGSNGLTLYFRVKGAGPTGPIAWSHYTVQDDAGFQYDQNGGYCGFGGGPAGQVVGLSLLAYPRRQPNFLFLLLNSSNAVLGSFRIQNTNAGPFPQWRPSPLPQTLTNGSVSLTLRGFARRQWGSYRDIIPSWGIKSGQPSWSNATVRYYNFLDATGNEGRNLSPKESAWKLRAQVRRPKAGDFGTGEKLVVANVPISGAGGFVSIDQSNFVSGVGIDALVLCGPGDFEISNGTSRSMPPGTQTRTGSYSSGWGNGTNTTTTEGWGFTNSFFLVEVTNVQPFDEIKFFLRDDHGREVKVEANGWSGRASGSRVYLPNFTAPADAKTVTLETVVDRPLIFDFLVDPKDMQSAKP
jgi:hypothetical protein